MVTAVARIGRLAVSKGRGVTVRQWRTPRFNIEVAESTEVTEMILGTVLD